MSRKSLNYWPKGCSDWPTSTARQDVLRRLDETFQAFLARVRPGENPASRVPVRSGGTTVSLFPRTAMGADCSMTASCVSQGPGRIKVKLHPPVEGEIKTVTIKRDVDHWYVCFSVQRDTVALPESSEEIGLDVGLDSFVALSKGTEISNPRHLKPGLEHLGRKAAALLAKAHRKIRNQRAAFHLILSRRLVERYGLIAVEDLNIKGLSRGIPAGPGHDPGWNSFFAKLWYEAASAGRELVKVDARGTNQVCVRGAAVPKALADRWPCMSVMRVVSAS